MKSSLTKAFRKKLNALPRSIPEQATKVYELWRLYQIRLLKVGFRF